MLLYKNFAQLWITSLCVPSVDWFITHNKPLKKLCTFHLCFNSHFSSRFFVNWTEYNLFPISLVKLFAPLDTIVHRIKNYQLLPIHHVKHRVPRNGALAGSERASNRLLLWNRSCHYKGSVALWGERDWLC